MVDIVIESENKLTPYKINFEDAKNYLKSELEKYQKLCVTEEFIQSAKKSRAELNAKKKELSAKFTEVKKMHNEPINILKEKVDELLTLIDEPLNKIDEQIKAYEEKVREQKKEDIDKIFEDAKKRYNFDKITLENIFNPQWLNVSYTKKKISSEIEVFFSRITSDLEVIESFDDEFVIPLRNLYLECFDMSTIMQRKIAYDKEKQERLQREKEDELRRLEEVRLQREREYLERKQLENGQGNGESRFQNVVNEGEIEEDRGESGSIQDQDGYEYDEIPEYIEPEEKNDEPQEPTSDFSDDVNINLPTEEEKCDTEQSQKIGEEECLIHIPFYVNVTKEQKLLMREFVLENKIDCGKLKQKTIEEITEILVERLNSVYCDNCNNTDSSCCEECNRKQMYWSLSRTEARNIAREILS